MQTNTSPGFLDSELEESQGREPLFQVIPVPLEQTVSYGGGTGRGPAAILAAAQLVYSVMGIVARNLDR